jgi:hypothetical protein
VTLPSHYTGGELMVGHNEEWKAYHGSKTALSLVAFYADCRHEVLKVASGYRITLTYNLLVHGDTSRPAGDEGTVAELADLLREHFRTPVPRYYGGPAADPPNRLVYLLDHEYTARGLGWRRLKGADASRAALLRSAAGKAGCEPLLALADIKMTHSAFPADESYGYRDWYDDYDEDEDEYPGDESGGEREYDVQELIDSEVTLTHWTGPDGTRLEQTSLYVDGNEVCASTPTGDLTPYSSEYEGDMGNWGNTLDRWYQRAAVIVWPGDRAFANRAETSPAWALDELGKPLAAVLTAAAAIDAASTRDTACGYVRKLQDAVTALEMSALRAAKLRRGRARGDAGFGDLAADCAARLRVRLARPRRASGDWSIELPAGGCACDLCDTLRSQRLHVPTWPYGESGSVGCDFHDQVSIEGGAEGGRALRPGMAESASTGWLSPRALRFQVRCGGVHEVRRLTIRWEAPSGTARIASVRRPTAVRPCSWATRPTRRAARATAWARGRRCTS